MLKTLQNSTKIYLRFIEFILLFFGVPLLIYFDYSFIHPSVIVLPVLVLIFFYLKRKPGFHFRELIFLRLNKNILLLHAFIVILSSIILFAAVVVFDRKNLLNLPRANPSVYIMLCILYPVFSAYGQEIIYRTFLFKRYRAIFRTNGQLIFASSIAFSFVHIVYYSHVSIILTFILGLYLSYTYLNTRSVLLTSIIHGILGDVIFTVGLGSYFWLDMYKYM
jgi:uncharacterized protein